MQGFPRGAPCAPYCLPPHTWVSDPVTLTAVPSASAGPFGFLLTGRIAMNETSDEQNAQAFLATVRLGEHCSGTVTKVTRDGDVMVALGGFPGRPLGVVGPLDVSWTRFPAATREVEVGQRVTAEVIAVDRDTGRVHLLRRVVLAPLRQGFGHRSDRAACLVRVPRFPHIERRGPVIAESDAA